MQGKGWLWLDEAGVYVQHFSVAKYSELNVTTATTTTTTTTTNHPLLQALAKVNNKVHYIPTS